MEQKKQLLIAAAVTAASKFYFQKDWKTALLYGAAAVVAIAVYDTVAGNTTT